jgi:hypothetical protein
LLVIYCHSPKVIEESNFAIAVPLFFIFKASTDSFGGLMKFYFQLFCLVFATAAMWTGMSFLDEYYGPNLTTEKLKIQVQPFKEEGKVIHSFFDSKIQNKSKDHDNSDSGLSGEEF